MTLFFTIIGTSAGDLSSLAGCGWLVAQLTVMVSVHWVVLTGVGAVMLRLPRQALLIGSNACIGGPATAAGAGVLAGVCGACTEAHMCRCVCACVLLWCAGSWVCVHALFHHPGRLLFLQSSPTAHVRLEHQAGGLSGPGQTSHQDEFGGCVSNPERQTVDTSFHLCDPLTGLLSCTCITFK